MAIIKHLFQLVYLFTDLQNWSGQYVRLAI